MSAPRSILIVEDDEAIRTLVSVICRRSGMLATTASTADEAIQLLGPDAKFCAIVLDLMMPGTAGTAVIEHLKSRDRIIPVVVATAAVHYARQINFDPRIVTAVIKKPFDTNELTAAIESACRKS